MIRIIAIAIIALTGAAHARDRDRLDPALSGGDVHVCDGLLTSSGTCIGSESNVAPEYFDGVNVYREHRDRDGQDDRRRRDRDEDE
jgi:hypothetical protein